MSSPVTTTYCGYQITVEPYEWGYLAEIVEPISGRRFIAARPSATRAVQGPARHAPSSRSSGVAVQPGLRNARRS